MQGHFDVFLREAISEENVSFGTTFEVVEGGCVGVHGVGEMGKQPGMFVVKETIPNVPFFGFPFEKPVWKRAKIIPQQQQQQQFPPLDLDVDSLSPQSLPESPKNSCVFCDDSFDSDHTLCWHQNSCPNNPFTRDSKPTNKCGTCNRTFNTELELEEHMCPGVGEKHTCEICGKTYRSLRVKLRHMQTHSDTRPYQCEVCQKSFFRKEYLVNHRRIHSGEKPFSCQICGKYFAYSSAKRSHMKLHLTTPYSCSTCLMNFTSTETLTAVDTSMGTVYKCETCFRPSAERQTTIKRKSTLNHLPGNSVKDSPRNLKCQYCPRLYIRQSDLTKHSRTHTASLTTPPPSKNAPITPPKPFSLVITPKIEVPHLKSSQLDCHLCEKRFTGKKMLTRHVYSHLGIKPFVCEVCAKRYARKEDLTLHIRTHTGERPFSCSMCERKFIRRRSYKLHLRTHGPLPEEIDLTVTDNAVSLGDPEN